MSKISFKAVVIGAISDVVLTNVFAIVSFFIIGIYFGASGASHFSAADFQNYVNTGPLGLFVGWGLGGLATVVGGYVSARIAKHDVLLNATLASFLCVLFAVLAIFSIPIIDVVIAIVLNPALAFVGGYIFLRRK